MSSFVGELVARRLAVAVVVSAVISVAVFTATEFLPGDVAQVVLGQSATPRQWPACAPRCISISRPIAVLWLHGLLTGNPGPLARQ